MASGRFHNFPILATLLGSAVFCAALPPTAHAAGFFIQEQSPSGLGSAYAGMAAMPEDASTIFYNPAGMTQLSGAQVTFGAHVLLPKAEMSDNGTGAATAATGGAFVADGGNDGGNPYSATPVPVFYAAMPVTPDHTWWLGLGVSAPFGLANDYDDGWFARYDSTESELTVIDVQPSIAWAPAEWISIGGALDVQHADATLENAIPSPATAGGPDPSTDGLQELTGDALTIGYNAGILLQPWDNTNIGLHYRSAVDHKLQGRLLVINPSDIPGVGGDIARVGGEADLKLPDMATLAVAHDVTEDLTVMAHAIWFGWSSFDAIRVRLDSGTSSSVLQNYDDTVALAVGMRYQLNPEWVLRAGYQYDPTPTTDNFRTTRTPDGDRNWFALGASYSPRENITIDLSGAYIDIGKEDIDLTRAFTTGTATIDGTSEGSVGIIALGMTYRF